MTDKYLQGIRKLTGTGIRVYLIGIFIVLILTLKEVLGLTYNNFQIFSFGSLDFWRHKNPYTDWHHLSVKGNPLDVFLYGPLFSIIFTPFAILPGQLGVICWNIFTYTLFYFSVFTLPDQFNFDKKKFIFLLSALLLFTTILSVQFNPVVAAIFLFSFTLFEKKKGFWAVLLILFAGFTKVYGIFQIIMLLFYPRFWKNTLYAVIIAIVFLFLPLVSIPANELVSYYLSWFEKIMNHSDALRFFSIYRPFSLLNIDVEPFMGFISIGVLLVIVVFTFLKLNLFKTSFQLRAQFLGIIMCWAILFGVSSEKHTYVIAMAGYVIWYLCSVPGRLDKILLWTNWVLLAVLPVDLICPWVISHFILAKLSLGVIVFSFTWFIMVYKTFTTRVASQNIVY
jgi:hypothetical protein